MKQVLLMIAVVMVGCGDSGLKEKVDEQSVMIADLKDDIKELKSAIDKLDAYITGSTGAGPGMDPITGLPMGGAGGGMGGPAGGPGGGRGGAGGPGRFPGAGGGLPGAGRGSAVDPSTGLPRPASQNPESQTRPRR